MESDDEGGNGSQEPIPLEEKDKLSRSNKKFKRDLKDSSQGKKIDVEASAISEDRRKYTFRDSVVDAMQNIKRKADRSEESDGEISDDDILDENE